METGTRITRILEVLDTRSYEEGPDDRWHPIPGSGTFNVCDRCGRLHEVHATVELSNGTTAVVGTGCMRAEGAEVAKRFERADRAAKRLAALRAELAAAERYEADYYRAKAEVDALPLPAMEETWDVFQVGRNAGERFPTLTMAEVVVWCHLKAATHADMSREDREEREACLVGFWRGNRMKDRGFDRYPSGLDYLRREIRKVEARLAAITKEGA